LDKESSGFVDAWWSGKELKEWHPFARVSNNGFSGWHFNVSDQYRIKQYPGYMYLSTRD
jgi:hypothetical protein